MRDTSPSPATERCTEMADDDAYVELDDLLNLSKSNVFVNLISLMRKLCTLPQCSWRTRSRTLLALPSFR